jgi:hypothetical protein
VGVVRWGYHLGREWPTGGARGEAEEGEVHDGDRGG